ncbi:MAG: c-type cytochrome [bacterium]
MNRTGWFHGRWFLYGVVGTLMLVAGGWVFLKAAGFPWNLMRQQPSIESMEQPFRPQPESTQRFMKSGWPRAGYRVNSLDTSTVLTKGKALYRRNCAHCHGPKGKGNGPVAKKLKRDPADLTSWAVQLMKPRYIHRLIAHPKAVMPEFQNRLTGSEREILVNYIRMAFAPESQPVWRKKSWERPDNMGRSIYKSLDCARCHGPDRTRKTPGIPPSLSLAGNKYKKDWVETFIAEPFVRRYKDDGVRSTLRMPEFRLKRTEIRGLADYLMTKRQDGRFEDPDVNWTKTTTEQIKKGRKLYKQYSCNGCHTIDGKGGKVGPDLSNVGNRLKPDYIYNFIRDPKKYIPNTAMKDKDLWPGEAEAITRYLSKQKSTTKPGQ